MSAPPESPVSGRPVASLTLAINYALAPEDVRDVMGPGGPGAPPDAARRFLRNVWGYRFVNLALHLLAALALFGVVRRTLVSDRLRAGFGAESAFLAFAVALVWLVHPLLTDAVTYVAQRTEVLMGLFYFVTLYCAIRALDHGGKIGTRGWWTAGAVAACALGMASKQTMVFAPLMVGLWDWMFGPARRAPVPGAGTPVGPAPRAGTRIPPGPPRRPGTRWWLYTGLAATWVILAALVAHERWPTSVGLGIEGWTPLSYLLTQAGVIVYYLRLAMVPVPLVSDYDGWPMARSILAVAPQAAFLALLLCATVILVLRRQGWGYVGAWLFAALAPSSSILPLPTEVVAERRMYVPLAAVVALAVIGGHVIGRRLLPLLFPDGRWRRVAGRLAALLFVGCTATVFAATTHARNRDYWSEERMWQDTVDKRPDNPRARLNYGVVLSTAQRHQEAEVQLREAVRLKDTSAAAHANLGSVLCTLGRLDEGISHLERALAIDPDYTDAFANLGEAYGAQGRRALAAQFFAKAVNAAPDTPFLLSRLGWLLATSPEGAVRNGPKAVEVSERAVQLTSRQNTMSLDTLAAAYAEVGRFDDAVATIREAMTVASGQGNQAILPVLEGRRSLYQARQMFRVVR